MGAFALFVPITYVADAALTGGGPPVDISQQSDGIAVKMATFPERFATVDALLMITSKQKANAILSAARLVLYNYTYTIQPARRPPPPEWRDYFARAPLGHCETGALVLADILGESFAAKNFNVVTLLPRVGQRGLIAEHGFTGHTATAFPLERGAVLIDPMFGIMLVTSNPDFNDDVMKRQDFQAYSLFSPGDPETDKSAFSEHTHIYSRLADPMAFSTYSGDRMIARPSGIAVEKFGETRIGKVDGESVDVTSVLDLWGNHVGMWYEPVTHEWHLAGAWPGVFEMKMDLIDGDGPILGLPLNLGVEVAGGWLLDTKIESRSLAVRFIAIGPVKILTSSVDMSGRKIDAISVRQLSPFQYLQKRSDLPDPSKQSA